LNLDKYRRYPTINIEPRANAGPTMSCCIRNFLLTTKYLWLLHLLYTVSGYKPAHLWIALPHCTSSLQFCCHIYTWLG